ncbi:MAG: hypothetical protein V4582_09530 [Pseudomonadota bacterium]
MTLIRKLSTVLALCAALSTSALADNARGPSTPEERARVSSVAQEVRKDPKGATAANAAWFDQWIADVPDYALMGGPVAKWCDRSARGELKGNIRFVYGVSAIDFQIKHQILEARTPAEAAAVGLAGLEGVLATYETLLAKDAANRSPKFDAALERRSKGELAAFIGELEQ